MPLRVPARGRHGQLSSTSVSIGLLVEPGVDVSAVAAKSDGQVRGRAAGRPDRVVDGLRHVASRDDLQAEGLGRTAPRSPVVPPAGEEGRAGRHPRSRPCVERRVGGHGSDCGGSP